MAAMAAMVGIDQLGLSESQLETLKEFSLKNADRLKKASTSMSTNCDDNEWTRNSTSNTDLMLDVWSSSVPNNPLKMFRAHCVFENYTPKQVYEFLMDNDTRLKWDQNVCHLNVTPLKIDVGTGETLVILNCRTNAVGPISGRDFVDVCCWKRTPSENGDGEDFDTYISAGATYLENEEIRSLIEKAFPLPKGFIRGKNFSGCGWHISGFKSEDGVPTTTVSYVIHSSLEGWFPVIIINNAISGSYVDFFKNSKAALQKK